jgi:hypothetical protein
VALISKRETSSKVPDGDENLHNPREETRRTEYAPDSKRNITSSDGASIDGFDSLIEGLSNQVYEIVKGINPSGKIRIPRERVIPHFKNREELDEELLSVVYARVSSSTGVEMEIIQRLMWDHVDVV